MQQTLLESFAALDSELLELENVVERNQEVYFAELAALVEADENFEFKTVAEIKHS